MARYNELYDRVADLTGKAFTPTHVCNNTLIFAGCAMKRAKENPARSKTTPPTLQKEAMEQKDYLLIRDL